MKYLKYICLVLLALFSIMSINSSIKAKSGAAPFSFSNEAGCQFKVYQNQLVGSFKNIPHIKGFFIMSLLGLISFGYKKYLTTSIFVGVLTFVTEFLQMWSPSRHCRLTDLIPNYMGFAFAAMIVMAFIGVKKLYFKDKRVLDDSNINSKVT